MADSDLQVEGDAHLDALRKEWGGKGGLTIYSSSPCRLQFGLTKVESQPGEEWGRVHPSNRLMWMCHWMGLHFQDWIDYNGVAISIELLECGRTFSGFWGSENSGR